MAYEKTAGSKSRPEKVSGLPEAQVRVGMSQCHPGYIGQIRMQAQLEKQH